MNRTALLLFSLMSVAACVTHRDYLVEFRLQGSIALKGSSAPAAPITVRMLDTGMDDVRSADRPAFLESQVAGGAPFVLTTKYFWGSEKANAYERATFVLRVEIPNCAAHEKEYRLAELPEEGGVVVVDVGALAIPCATKS